jgi:hypothetical protein
MGRSGEAMCPIDVPPEFVDDDFEDKPPYKCGEDMYWCSGCSCYTKDFFPSSIARNSRQCRQCKHQARKARVQTHVSKLRTRLFKAFNRIGIKGHRSVFKKESSIVYLIKSRGLSVKDVEAIIPPKSEADLSNVLAYRFILRSGLDLKRERDHELKVRCLKGEHGAIMQVLCHTWADMDDSFAASKDPLAYVRDYLPRYHYLFNQIGINFSIQ